MADEDLAEPTKDADLAMAPSNYEGILQGIKAFIPQNRQELGDVGKMVLHQLPMGNGGQVSPMTMGPFGAGLNMAGTKEVPSTPMNTEWGNVLEKQFVNPALLTTAAVPLAGGAIRGIGSLFDVAGATRNMGGVIRQGAEKASEAL